MDGTVLVGPPGRGVLGDAQALRAKRASGETTVLLAAESERVRGWYCRRIVLEEMAHGVLVGFAPASTVVESRALFPVLVVALNRWPGPNEMHPRPSWFQSRGIDKRELEFVLPPYHWAFREIQMKARRARGREARTSFSMRHGEQYADLASSASMAGAVAGGLAGGLFGAAVAAGAGGSIPRDANPARVRRVGLRVRTVNKGAAEATRVLKGQIVRFAASRLAGGDPGLVECRDGRRLQKETLLDWFLAFLTLERLMDVGAAGNSGPSPDELWRDFLAQQVDPVSPVW